MTSARQYSIYQGENAQVTTYCLEKADYHQYYDEDTLLGLSDYNALRAMKGWAGGDPGRRGRVCSTAGTTWPRH